MIIDANVFKGYFQITIGSTHDLCGCPKILIDNATSSNPIYHDIDGIISSEWQAVVDREWFEPWLADQLEAGTIAYIIKKIDLGLERNLTSNGFPKTRDLIYVRVGLSAVESTGLECSLFTEDIDFYDPKKKGIASKTRKKMLSNSSGPVAKLLKKNLINVKCVP